MRGNRIPKLCLVVLLALTVHASEPIGHWPLDGRLDDVIGTADGTFFGGAPNYVQGKLNQAIMFDGVDDYVEVMVANLDAYTISAWVKPERPDAASIVVRTSSSGTVTHWSHQIRIAASGVFEHYLWDGSERHVFGTTPVGAGDWYFVAITASNNGPVQLYVNGQEEGDATTVGAMWGDGDRFHIGSNSGHAMGWFQGIIDDVRIYAEVLPPEEIERVMKSNLKASSNPIPEDTTADVPRDVVLGWSPGESAATHDVYFGTGFDDVNDAGRGNPMDVLASQGQTTTTYDPDGVLDFGQTYYWRVDEVNAAPDNTIFKGQVWSFTAEPFAYPITNVVATSTGISEASAGPERTVDGSGLSPAGEHSTASADMWLAVPGAGPISVLYEFDGLYKLHEMLVWNYNVQFELLLGFGVKDVTVEHSENGTDWTVLGDVQLAQATARANYAANTAIEFNGVAVRYVRLTVLSGWGPMGQFGLSEVQFMYIPAQAREPQPADGATGVALDTVLGWRAGREAVSHEVYFGTDPNALALAGTVSETSLDPGVFDLATTYCWQVNEVNEADAVTVWPGGIWSFTTQEHIVVEDFESYDDNIDDGTAIFQSWIDSWEEEAYGGSQVGHTSSPFAETTTVHGGQQAMPLFYDNTGLTLSETKYTFAARDWTASGIRSLSVFLAGEAANSGGQLYLKINNTRVDYDGETADIRRTIWQAWNIDLSAIGGNLSSVTSLTIGIEGAGATGVVYIDDIRLYPRAPEYITPVEPEPTNLVAHYTFDEGAGAVVGDASGNGNDGAINGDPVWTTGILGGALEFSGNDYVDCGNDASLVIRDALTVACWIKVAAFVNDWEAIIAMGDDSYRMSRSATNGNSVHFGCNGTATGTNLDAAAIVADDTWHHVALVYDGVDKIIYIDGVEDARMATTGQIDASSYNLYIGENSQATGRYFHGLIDDARVYSRPLSPDEVAGLAGRTKPMHKPF